MKLNCTENVGFLYFSFLLYKILFGYLENLVQN